jgi:phosphosulfolactate phosphohydrolase-like enzyme
MPAILNVAGTAALLRAVHVTTTFTGGLVTAQIIAATVFRRKRNYCIIVTAAGCIYLEAA